MFKISTVGWHTCLQSIAVLSQHCQWLSAARQAKSAKVHSVNLGLFLASVAAYNKTLAFSPSLTIQWIEVGWTGTTHYWRWSHSNMMKLETGNVKNDGYYWKKINAILLNIKINRPKLINMCRYKRATYWQNFLHKHLTWVKNTAKSFRGATFLLTLYIHFNIFLISFTNRRMFCIKVYDWQK